VRSSSVALLVAAAALVACGDDVDPQASECAVGERFVRESGLELTDLACGEGETAVGGSTVTVHYIGRLEDQEVFDSSRRGGEPFTFLLGAGRVIEGWEEGVRGMRPGGTRRLVVPPDVAYGEEGYAGVIPPDATLIFDIELLDVNVRDD
jgi:FKBP-type peptidyl-prolyl cis-trans isomerase